MADLQNETTKWQKLAKVAVRHGVPVPEKGAHVPSLRYDIILYVDYPIS